MTRSTMQALGLIGATVTGTLARKRRLKLERLNRKLRKVNSQLMKRRAEEVSFRFVSV